MSTGMQVFGPDGRLYVDMSSNISQHMGSVVTNSVNGSIGLPGLPGGKTYFYYIVPIQGTAREQGKYPGVTISGNVMSWQYSFSTWFGAYAANCRIYYGYY